MSTTTTSQVEFTREELLSSHAFAEPLVAQGVRCHGGFDDAGEYVSPRTLHRVPAIEAWEEQRVAQFGSEKLAVPLERWPEPFPNVAQTKLMLRHGITDPTISALTRIGTVEGFGGLLRMLPVPDLTRCFEEEVTGTATAHIPLGLFEAHARDEAGWEDEAGHDRMWFAARDIAFEDPLTEDQSALMMQRMGFAPAAGGSTPDAEELRRAAIDSRVLPGTIPLELEVMVTRMISLLFIEISAFHTFRWAEEVLADPDLTAGEGEAARIVSFIRADETPHVGYIQVALSEMRDRTWVGTDGSRHAGAELMPVLWDRALELSTVARRSELLQLTMREIDRALEGRRDHDDLVDELLSLGSVVRLADGSVADRSADVSLA